MANPADKPVIGVDVGGTKVLAGVVDRDYKVRATAKRPTKGENGVDAVVERIAKTARDMGIPDAGERLACYDRTVGAMATARESKDLVIADRETMREARRGLFGLSLPSIKLFGGGDSEDVKAIESTIESTYAARDGQAIFVLADGARWKQIAGRPVYAKRGDCYTQKGDYATAQKDFNKAILFERDNYLTYVNRGKVFLKLNKANQALLDFRKATEINPNGWEAFLYRGMTYFDQKKFKLSLDDLDQAIRLNPTSGIAYFYRGACKDNLKDAAGGCADLKKSAELGYKEAEERAKKYCR